MDFNWTDEQLEFRKSVVAFAKNELDLPSPESRGFSRDLWRKCGAFGIQGLTVPEEFGGSGADVLTTDRKSVV